MMHDLELLGSFVLYFEIHAIRKLTHDTPWTGFPGCQLLVFTWYKFSFSTRHNCLVYSHGNERYAFSIVLHATGNRACNDVLVLTEVIGYVMAFPAMPEVTGSQFGV